MVGLSGDLGLRKGSEKHGKSEAWPLPASRSAAGIVSAGCV